jgi:hypothetical protein
MDFTISSVSGSDFELLGLPATAGNGFAAGASAFFVRRIAPTQTVLPEYLFITTISKAANAVVRVSTTHQYVAGMKIRLSIPSSYGMVEMDGLEATIVSVGTSGVGLYELTIDVDSSGFTAFTFPESAPSVNQVRFATLAPAGQRAYYDVVNDVQYGYNVNEAPFRSSRVFPYMYLAPGAQSPAGSTSDVIAWQAFRYGGN